MNISTIIVGLVNLPEIVEIIVVIISLIWSCLGLIVYLVSIGFISALVPSNKKYLCVYPVFLYYLFIAWIILLVN